MIEGENGSAPAQDAGRFIFQFGTDRCEILTQDVLVDAALDAELCTVFFAEFHDIHAGGGFAGIETVDAAVDERVEHTFHVAVAVL